MENNLQIILTISTATAIIALFSVLFFFKIKNHPATKPLSGFSLLFFLFFRQIENFLEHSLGSKFTKFAPLLAYFFFYVLVNSMLSAFIGDPFISPFRYPIFILIYGALVTIAILATRIYFQGFKSLVAYLNPMELMSLLSSFISISFRLFGNLFAGYLILCLFYSQITSDALPDLLKTFNVLALIALPLHLYFDLFSTTLQITIFLMLAVTYLTVVRPEKFIKKKE